MSEPARTKTPDTARRLQIALIGLFAVVLVGSVTRVVVDKAVEETAAEELDMGEGEQPNTIENTTPAAAGTDEPLAELGVQPTLEKPAEEQVLPPDAE